VDETSWCPDKPRSPAILRGAIADQPAPADPSIEGIDDPTPADPGGEAESLGAFIRTAALVMKQKSAAGAAGDQA
jgi:hypothetical protein